MDPQKLLTLLTQGGGVIRAIAAGKIPLMAIVYIVALIGLPIAATWLILYAVDPPVWYQGDGNMAKPWLAAIALIGGWIATIALAINGCFFLPALMIFASLVIELAFISLVVIVFAGIEYTAYLLWRLLTGWAIKNDGWSLAIFIIVQAVAIIRFL